MRTETDAILSLQRAVAAVFPDFTAILTEVENEIPERPFAVVSAIDNWTPDDALGAPTITLPVSVYAYVSGGSRKDARQRAEDAREMLWTAFMGAGAAYNSERLVPLYDYTGQPAVQTYTLPGATGGTWKLGLPGGAHTAPLDVGCQPRDVRLALEALAIDLGDPAPVPLANNLMAFGKRAGPWTIRFDGALRGRPIPALTIDATGLTGTPEPDVEIITAGAPEPWRDPRDYLRMEAPTFGGMPDPDDPRLRTVTLTCRLTWGRSGHVPFAEMTFQAIRARRSTTA
jgi:hypothetical protein